VPRERIRAFAVAHPDQSLGGIAYLRMADDAYMAGKYADAVVNYDNAIRVLKEGPLVARAQLGGALARLQSGKIAEGQGELKRLSESATQLKAVRAEATYHLTSLAVEAADATAAQKYVDQLMQLDPASPWTQRAFAIRATLPATPAAATAATPAATEKKDEPKGVQLNIPGR